MATQYEKPTGAPPAALIGKVPARADFVRENVTRSVSHFDRWLTRGMEDLHASRQQMPAIVVRFAMRVPDEGGLLLGVFTPSTDQLGRHYPLVLLSELPAAGAPLRMSALPAACGAFYAELQNIAFEIPALTMEAIRERLQAVAPPAAAVFERAGQLVDQTLATTGAASFLAEVFPGLDRAGLCYGLHTFRSGIAKDRSRGSGPGIVLDCPIGIDVDLMAWLELPHRMGADAQLGAVFWVQEPEPRMLLCVGSAPTQVLQLLADPSRRSQLLWPLTTGIEEARLRAEAVLAPRIAALLEDPNASVASMWAEMARGV